MTLRFLGPGVNLSEIETELKKWFQHTKFVVHEIKRRPYSGYGKFKGGDITLLRIRLKKPVFYYGYGPIMNEPPLVRRRWGAGSYRPRRDYLAGLDWIEFNDVLNDFMDHRRLSVNIGTKHCIIRCGIKRRVIYNASMQKFCGNTRQVFWWERVPKSDLTEGFTGFVDGVECPLLPFSTCNTAPGGFYKMINDSPEP